MNLFGRYLAWRAESPVRAIQRISERLSRVEEMRLQTLSLSAGPVIPPNIKSESNHSLENTTSRLHSSSVIPDERSER